MWIQYNANPESNRTEDCTVRAISKLTGKTWDEVYMGICLEGLLKADMPMANRVWGKYLRRIGYKRYALPNSCPDCYTVEDFARDYPDGKYLLSLEGHTVTVENGDWFDTWDSGSETPVYYWSKEE